MCLAQDKYASKTYKLEIYWTRNTIGFRQRNGEKKQLFSIGGPKCELSMDVLQGWAEETLKRLDTDKSWEKTCEWVKSKVK